jgi:hypothetical protein
MSDEHPRGAEAAKPSFSAAQVLGALEAAVGERAPAARWLEALAKVDPAAVAAAGGPSDIAARLAAARDADAEAAPLRRADVLGLAARWATDQARQVATVADIAAALLAAVPRHLQAVEPPPDEPAEGATPMPPPATGEVTLSYSADQLVRSLTAGATGLHELLVALVDGHGDVAATGGPAVDLAAVVAGARQRMASGDPGDRWDHERLGAAASARAAAAGRLLVASADVAAVLLAAWERAAAHAPEPGLPVETPAPTVGQTGRARTFRLFVSSTFADFVLERDALRERVWPRLRAYCRSRGAHFQEVDLRWGVSSEAAIDQQTMNICLSEIERCKQLTPRPSFLVLVGDRYGWMPPPPQIPLGDWEAITAVIDPPGRKLLERWYSRDDNAAPPEYRLRPRRGKSADPAVWEKTEARLHRALADAVTRASLPEGHGARYLTSATEQEIVAGAIEAERPDQVVCYLREIVAPAQLTTDGTDDVVRRYVDADGGPIRALKGRLAERAGPERVLTETVEWGGDDGPALDDAYLTRFTDAVHDALRAAIAEELDHPVGRPGLPGGPDADGQLDEEARAHDEFAAQRIRFLTGRMDELKAIRTYVDGDDARPLVVYGEGGAGKSTLMAAAVRDARRAASGATVIARYVGATPGSTDSRALLQGLCRELARRRAEPEPQIPTDPSALVADFQARLAQATAARPVAVFVDSLEQLSDTGAAGGPAWLPLELPPHARLVVSSRPGDVLQSFAHRASLLELGGLPAADGAELLDQWLADAGRMLQPEQRAHLLDCFERSSGNPLYLKLAFEEARRWSSDGGEPPATLAIGVTELIRANLFRRLEREEHHGSTLVAHALGYLSTSRYGLGEDELLDLLSRDVDVYGWFLAQTFHVPADLRDAAEGYQARHDTSGLPEDDAAGPDPVAATGQWIELLRSDPSRRTELTAFLEDVLPRPDGPRLPVVLWSRLFADVEPYLSERRAEGGDLLDFHHRELRDSAADVYAPGDRGRVLHGRLADYFEAKADPERDRSWGTRDRPPDVRGLSELPHHLIQAARWDAVEETLTDFRFLEQKALRVGVTTAVEGDHVATVYSGVYHLQDDFDEALRLLLPGASETPSRPRIIVTGTDLGAGLVIRCPHCDATHAFRDEWRGEAIECPNPACAGPLKVNPFVVEPPPGT